MLPLVVISIKKFLWKGKDKVTRKSAINGYEGGGIKIVIYRCVEGIKNFQVYGYIGFQSKVKLKYETEKYTKMYKKIII